MTMEQSNHGRAFYQDISIARSLTNTVSGFTDRAAFDDLGFRVWPRRPMTCVTKGQRSQVSLSDAARWTAILNEVTEFIPHSHAAHTTGIPFVSRETISAARSR
jgi:hypothetical protein